MFEGSRKGPCAARVDLIVEARRTKPGPQKTSTSAGFCARGALPPTDLPTKKGASGVRVLSRCSRGQKLSFRSTGVLPRQSNEYHTIEDNRVSIKKEPQQHARIQANANLS